MTTAQSVHKCVFPLQPPRGSFVHPGPCECGKTWERGQAEQALRDAEAEMILNAMEGIGPDEPGAGWDGTETAQDWYDRTRAADEFNGGKPVRIVSRPGPDITIGTLVLSPSPGRADLVCAVPVPGGICGKPLAEGPCVIDHSKTEVDEQASLFDPAEGAATESTERQP